MQSVPSIKYLVLDGLTVCAIGCQSKRVDLFPNLRRIDLHKPALLSDNDSNESLPCEEVNIFGLRSTSNLSTYSSKTAKQLTVHNAIELCHEERYIAFDSSLWPSIEALTIPITAFSLNLDLNLHYIRKLCLLNDTLPVYSSLKTTTAICRFLATNTSHCPALEFLSFGQCPEWDIYFIMLESRIINQSRGSTPFKTLELPSNIPPHLLKYVCELLQGRLPIRPSNRELSLMGCMERLFDQKIPDCLSCIVSRAKCKLLSSHAKTTRVQKTSSRTAIQYPSDEVSILLSWEGRFEQWRAIAENTFVKRHYCHRGVCRIRLDRFSSKFLLYLL
ncbi:hypothetical protein CPB86DRAFT_694578 [Serendipita vermifera]|nr:hypothetical protein CPB86DRAFT_694578 [Serendipita vermifera]